MEPGDKRTTIARIAARLAYLCGAIGLLSGIRNKIRLLQPHAWVPASGLGPACWCWLKEG